MGAHFDGHLRLRNVDDSQTEILIRYVCEIVDDLYVERVLGDLEHTNIDQGRLRLRQEHQERHAYGNTMGPGPAHIPLSASASEPSIMRASH